MGEPTTTPPTAPAFLKGPRGDVDQFNMARWLYANLMKQETGRDRKDIAPWEVAYVKSRVAAFEATQDQLPVAVRKDAKAQAELNGQDGGFLAPEEWSLVFYDVIRDNSLFRTLPVERRMTFARIQHLPLAVSEWSFNYVGDNAPVTSADIKYAQRHMTMHKCIALRTLSLEMFQDAADLADAFLRQSAGEAVAYEQDKQTLIGNGQGGTPVGLLGMTNVGVTDISGASPTMVQLAQMIYNAKSINQSTNVPPGSSDRVAVVAHPRLENTVRNMTTPGSTAPWLFGLGQGEMQRFLGVDWVLTASVPITFTNKTTPTGGSQTQIFAGDWRWLRVTTRGDFEFVLSREAGMQNNQILCRIMFRFDVTATHPEAFNMITSAIQ